MKWYFYLIAFAILTIMWFSIKNSIKIFKTENKRRKSSNSKTYMQYIITGVIAGIILMILQLTISTIQNIFLLRATSLINTIDNFLIGLVALSIGFGLAIFVIASFFKYYPKDEK